MEQDKTNPAVTSAVSLFSKCFSIVQQNIEVFSLVFLVPAINLLFQVALKNNFGINAKSLEHSIRHAGPYLILAAVAYLVVNVIFSLLQLLLATIVATGKKPTFGAVWQEFRIKGWKLFRLQLLIGIMLVVGLLLFILPGLIVIKRYYFAPYVLMDQNTGIKQALRISHRYTMASWKHSYGLLGFMLLLSCSGIFPIVGSIVSFILVSVYSVAPALRYFELKKIDKEGSPSSTVSAPSPL